jgi:cytochrome b6-f complex iron-sulfur subunit
VSAGDPKKSSKEMPMDPTVTRRTALTAGAIGVGAVALAACSSNSSGSGAGAGATSTAANGGSQGAGSQGAGKTLAVLSDIPVGEAVSAKLPDGSPAIVAQPTAGTAACFSAICTHMGCTVNPAGKELHCPCHGSVYDASTGEVKQGPAPKPLPKITVHVSGGNVISG